VKIRDDATPTTGRKMGRSIVGVKYLDVKRKPRKPPLIFGWLEHLKI